MNTLANKFKALSEDVRLQILALIVQHGELCVCEVERLLEISQSKASRHLRYLLNAGLVQDQRDGLWIYYRLAEPDSKADRRFLDRIQVLLADVPLPDVGHELQEMRAARCGPARPAAVGEQATVKVGA
jgi:ArsR family transcriptional regulator